MQTSISFEPLGDHDRSSFHCGVPELDRYLHTRAGQDAKRKVAAPFVMIDEARRILGYYTLSAYGIKLTELPPGMQKMLPKYPLLPATLLGRLAVSASHRGMKLGRLLLMDALHRSWKNTAEIASVGVVADAKDEAALEFYLHHEFMSLADHPKKLFVSMVTLQRVFGGDIPARRRELK
jgi:predicted GNAT family N-acyltransferase